jgi:hypothetical protein
MGNRHACARSSNYHVDMLVQAQSFGSLAMPNCAQSIMMWLINYCLAMPNCAQSIMMWLINYCLAMPDCAQSIMM